MALITVLTLKLETNVELCGGLLKVPKRHFGLSQHVDGYGPQETSDSGDTTWDPRRRKASGGGQAHGNRNRRKSKRPSCIRPAQQQPVEPRGVLTAPAAVHLETLVRFVPPRLSDEAGQAVMHAVRWVQLICVEGNPRAGDRGALRCGLGMFVMMCLQYARLRLSARL
jgi:hypothetical protein